MAQTRSGTDAGQLSVTAALSPANAGHLTLESGGDVLIAGDIATVSSLHLLAGDDILQLPGTTITTGAFTATVDPLTMIPRAARFHFKGPSAPRARPSSATRMPTRCAAPLGATSSWLGMGRTTRTVCRG